MNRDSGVMSHFALRARSAAVFLCVLAAARCAAEELADWSRHPWPEAAEGPRFRKSYLCVDYANPYGPDVKTRNGYRKYVGGLALQLEVDSGGRLHIIRRTSLAGGRHRELCWVSTTIYQSAAVADFGAIEAGAGRFAESGMDVSWATARLYNGEEGDSDYCTVLCTRLSPAIVCETEAQSVGLFAGDKWNTALDENAAGRTISVTKGYNISRVIPRYLAVKGPAGVRTAATAPSAAGMFAFSSPQGTGDSAGAAKGPCSLEELRLHEAEAGWMLVWYGTDSLFYSCRGDFDPKSFYKADSPFLIVFQNAPYEAENGGDRLVFNFDGAAGRIAVLPLFGEEYPPAESTEKWAADGVPDAVVALCERWAEYLCAVPVEVEETYSYDAASDTVEVREKFEFVSLREAGKRLLPLPPAVALAKRAGMAVFAPETTDTGFVTAFGPYEAAVSDAAEFSFAVRGLRKYAYPPQPQPRSNAPHLQARLEAQLGAVLEAGHLAPYLPMPKEYSPSLSAERLCWSNPAESIYYLLLAQRLAPPDMAGRIEEYVRAEKAKYPPARLIHLPAAEGGMRPWHRLEPGWYAAPVPQRANNFHCIYGLLPCETLYYMSEYYSRVAPEELKADWPAYKNTVLGWRLYSDWATGGWFKWDRLLSGPSKWGPQVLEQYYGHGGVAEANRWLAAMIGYVRMAEQLGVAEEERREAWGLLARAACLRAALERMPSFFFERGLLQADSLQPVIALDELGATCSDVYGGRWAAFQGLAPETAAFLRDFAEERTRRQMEHYEKHVPWWFMMKPRSVHMGEAHYHYPEDAYYGFLAEALILQAPAAHLEQHLDVPWVEVGDWYYLGKLVLAICAAAP